MQLKWKWIVWIFHVHFIYQLLWETRHFLITKYKICYSYIFINIVNIYLEVHTLSLYNYIINKIEECSQTYLDIGHNCLLYYKEFTLDFALQLIRCRLWLRTAITTSQIKEGEWTKSSSSSIKYEGSAITHWTFQPNLKSLHYTVCVYSVYTYSIGTYYRKW